MSHTSFSDSDWEMLLAFIQERSVIPVIGTGLSEIIDPESGEKITFEKWLCSQLAERVDIEATEDLDTFVGNVQEKGGNVRSLYPMIRNLVLNAPFSPPDSLRKLASILDFPLYVTTGFDGLLSSAVLEERGESPDEFSYCPKNIQDLPSSVDSLSNPTVYQLFGKVAATAKYAICDEDVLEWISALQSETYAPERLVSELQEHHLLFIGVNYPDWLGRFFVRTAKRKRLSEDRDWFEFVVQPEATGDRLLSSFLRQVSRNTFVIGDCSDPASFVDELHRRWQAGSSSPSPRAIPQAGPVRFLPPAREMPENSLFLSYSRNDLDTVKRLKSGLDANGFQSWFDLEQLGTGDNYSEKIRRNIERCSYFIPVISSAALARDEAFFYREWSWAFDRRRGMGPGAVFILPVIVDDTPTDHHRIEDFSRNCDIAFLPGGEMQEGFIDRLKDLIGAAHA
ncbi:MAG: toll/interleukin-1 receptor domain-containing protein [Luteolibacter sp.]